MANKSVFFGFNVLIFCVGDVARTCYDICQETEIQR